MSKKSIFIHSLFRTGSTYIWNRFRQNLHYHCYYEPFHQALTDVTADQLETALTINFKLVNHPPIERYYLYEYRNLLEADKPGIPFFKKRFSFDEYCDNSENPDLKQYIDFLLKGAGFKTPVLQFNRSALRIPWFKAHYPESLHIYLVRNPRDQWASYEYLYTKTKDPTFFIMDLMTASFNQGHESFSVLAQYLPLIEFHSEIFHKEWLFYKVMLDLYSASERYLLFYFIWLTALIENVLHADIIINMNLLSQDLDYRERILQLIFGQRKADIDFDDCQIKVYDDHLFPEAELQAVEEHVHNLMAATLGKQRLNEFLKKISPEDQRFLSMTPRKFHRPRKKSAGVEETVPKNVYNELRRAFMSFVKVSHKQESSASGTQSSEDYEGLKQEIRETVKKLTKTEKERMRISQELEKKTRILDRTQELLSDATQALAETSHEAQQRIQRLEGDLKQKDYRIWEIRTSYAYRIASVMVYPFKQAKKLYKDLKRSLFRKAKKAALERKAREAQKNHKLLSSDRNGIRQKINLNNALEIFYGQHRSGLHYAFESLIPLHTENGVLFDGFIERTFFWSPEGIKPHLEPWIGIIHVPPNVPEWFLSEQSNDAIFATKAWKQSLPHCRGLFAFSEYHRNSLVKKLDVPIDVLTFATETPNVKWDPEKFQANPDKKIAQIGWWLRKLHSIFQLEVQSYRKICIKIEYADVENLMAVERTILEKKGTFHEDMYRTVEILEFLDNALYDELLSENIVIANLYDSSANNLITECMVRNTPLLVNPIEPVKEYLGEAYPLYFHDLEEAARKAEDQDLILEAHHYLKELPIKTRLTSEHFFKTFSESSIYRSL